MVADEETSQESTICFLIPFQEPVQAAGIVEPGKGTLHLPVLATVPVVMTIFWGTPEGNGDVIFTVGRNRDNATGTEVAAQRVAIIPFIQAQVVGFTFALADANSIYKPAVCALFPLEKDAQDRWYVRQKGFKREKWDLFCLDPSASEVPAAASLQEEIALARRFTGEEGS